jgi:hypothetical protein
MRNKSKRIQTLCLALLPMLAGCEYKTITVSPEMEGVLIINGKPASSAEIFFGPSEDPKHPCPADSSAITDSNGKFHIPAKTERSSVSSIKARRFSTTENHMCFKYQGELIIGDYFLTELMDKKKYLANCRLPVPPDAIAEDNLICNMHMSNYAIKGTSEWTWHSN